MPFVVLIFVAVVVWFVASPFIVMSMWNRLAELESTVKRLQQLANSRSKPSEDRLTIPVEDSTASPTLEPVPLLTLPTIAASVIIDSSSQLPNQCDEIPQPKQIESRPIFQETSRERATNEEYGSPVLHEETIGTMLPPVASVAKPVTSDEPSTLEEILAGKWLTWVGALAVIIGVGFGFKYAVENGWLDPSRRVILGLLVGVLSFGGGAFSMRRDYRFLGQGLTGAAMGILYMSCFAAHVWYGLVSYEVAFLGMALTTAGGLAFAARFDSQPTAFLGLLGGFLTPAMLHGSTDQFWVLFPYVLLLDAGVLYVATQRRWLGLQNLAFVGTCLTWWTWYSWFYNVSKLAPTIAFLSAFFVLFALIGVMQNIVRKQIAVAGDFFLIMVAPVAYFGALYGLTYELFPFWQGAFALGMTVIYGCLAILNSQINPQGRPVAALLAGLAGTFLIIAAPLQFTGHWVTIAWIAESVLLVEIGLRFNEKTLTVTGLSLLAKVQFILLIYALATFADPVGFQTAFVRKQFHLINGPEAMETSWTNIFNGRSFSYLVDVVGMAWLALTCRRRAKAGQADDLFGMKGRDLELWLAAGVPLIGLMLAITETFVWGMLRNWHGLSILSGFTMWAALAGVIVIAWSVLIGPRPLEKLGWFLFVLMGGGLVINAGWTVTGIMQSGTDATYWADHWWLFNPGGMAFACVLIATGLTALIYSTAFATRDDDLESLEHAESKPVSLQLVFTSGAFMVALAMVLQETFVWGVMRDWHGLTILSALTTWTAAFGATVIAWSVFVGPRPLERLGHLLFLPMGGALALSLVWTCDGVTAHNADWDFWLAHWWLINPRGMGFLSVIIAGVISSLIYSKAVAVDISEQASTNSRIPLDRLFGCGAFILALTIVLLETFAWGKTHTWTSMSILNAFVMWTSLFGAGLAVWMFVRRSVGLDGLLVSTFALLGGFLAMNSITTLEYAKGNTITGSVLHVAMGSANEAAVDWWLLNPRGLSFLMAIGAALLAARLERSLRLAQASSIVLPGNATTRGEQFGLMACFVGLAAVWLETAAWGLPQGWLADTLASSLAIGAAPFALGLAVWATWYRRHAMNEAVATVFALLGICLFVAGITALDGRSTLVTASLDEAAVCLWLLHPRGAAFLISIAAAGIAAAFYLGATRHSPDDPSTIDRDPDSLAFDANALLFSQTLGVSTWLAGLAMFTIEAIAQGAARHWQTETSLAITLSWTAFALGTLIAGIYWRSGTVRVLALSVFVLTVAKVFLFDVWHLDTVIRVFAFVSLGVTLLLVSFLYRHYRERIRDWIAPAA